MGAPSPSHLLASARLAFRTFSARSSSSSRWFSSSTASSTASRSCVLALGRSDGTAGGASVGTGGHDPRLGSALGLPLTRPPRCPFLQRRGLHLEVEQLSQDGHIMTTTAQVGQHQGPAMAAVSAAGRGGGWGGGGVLCWAPGCPPTLSSHLASAASGPAGGRRALRCRAVLGWKWAIWGQRPFFGEQPGHFPQRGAEPCSSLLGLTLRAGVRPHPAVPLGIAWASAAAAHPPAPPGAGTALRGGKTCYSPPPPRKHSPVTPKPLPVPTCSLLLQLLGPRPDFSHVLLVGFQQLRCPQVPLWQGRPLAGLSLRHRGRRWAGGTSPTGLGTKPAPRCG